MCTLENFRVVMKLPMKVDVTREIQNFKAFWKRGVRVHKRNTKNTYTHEYVRMSCMDSSCNKSELFGLLWKLQIDNCRRAAVAQRKMAFL